MCVSLPMRVARVDGSEALVECAGASRRVSLAILAAEGIEVRPGDWLMVAAGIAHRMLEEADARELIDMLEEGASP